MKKITFFISFIFLLACSTTPEVTSKLANDKLSRQVSKAETRGPENGTLLIVGGAASIIFYEKFMELVGGAEAPVIVIPTAGKSEDFSTEDLNRIKTRMQGKGFKNVTVRHTHNQEVANSDSFLEPFKTAKGVWFTGGRQWRLVDSYHKTKTHDELWKLLERGGVIAGSSAGATIQGSYLARGDTKANTIMMGDHEVGLGFVSNVAIDQHLFRRNRQFDLFEILENRPELLGIGLDEDTGIIVSGDRFTVFGNSYVAIYDGTRWSRERDTVYDLPKGSKEFYVLKEGEEYDMKNRKVVFKKN